MIGETKQILSKYWVIEDSFPIDIVLGTAVASFLDVFLWERVTGASRSGKSDLLTALGKYPDFKTMDTITPASIRGGLRGGGNLAQIMRNKKLLIMKDWGAISKMKWQNKAELLGLLRVVSDGEVVAMYGSKAGLVTRKYDFNIILGVVEGTIDRMFESQQGQRFIDVRWAVATPEEIQAKIRDNIRCYGQDYHRQSLEPEFAEAVCNLISAVKDFSINQIIPEVDEKIGMLAEQVAILRGGVPRNREHEVIGEPQIEMPSTLTSSFMALAKGIAMTRAQPTIDWTIYNQILRVARNCVPLKRVKILGQIIAGNKSKKEIERQTGIADTLVSRETEDMKLLGLPRALDKTGLAKAMVNRRDWRGSIPCDLEIED